MHHSVEASEIKEKLFKTIADKDCTLFDFLSQLKICKRKNIQTTDIKTAEGLNLLHLCFDKGRLSFLPVFVYLGWWNVLSKQKVSGYINHGHNGRTAKQISDAKKSKRYLLEYNYFSDWDASLTPLMNACRSGDIPIAKQLLEIGGVEIFYQDSNGGNALYWAVVGGYVDLIKELANKGLDPAVKTRKRENLLHVACAVGNSHVIQLLLTYSMKQDPFLEDKSGKTALDRNAENGDIETLQIFLEENIMPNESCITLSANAGKTMYLHLLLTELKMSVNSVDVYNRTPLFRACEGNRTSVVSMLLEHNADITFNTTYGRNLLHVIAENGSVELLRIILNLFNKERILKDFINAHDRYNGVELCFLIRGRDKGREAYHYVEVKRYLTPIFLVKTKSGNVDVAMFGNVLKSGWGVNPTQEAVEEIEQLFEDRRLDQTAGSDMTPLLIAIYKGHGEIAKMLIRNGANVNSTDKFGNTPLMLAASRGDMKTACLLEQRGADFNAVNYDGQDIHYIAAENEQHAIVNYIKARNYQEITKNFCHTKIRRLERSLSPVHLGSIRSQGGDVKTELINTKSLKNFRLDIIEFLITIGSGPVLEVRDNDPTIVIVGSNSSYQSQVPLNPQANQVPVQNGPRTILAQTGADPNHGIMDQSSNEAQGPSYTQVTSSRTDIDATPEDTSRNRTSVLEANVDDLPQSIMESSPSHVTSYPQVRNADPMSLIISRNSDSPEATMEHN